jgi:hypothetical protein
MVGHSSKCAITTSTLFFSAKRSKAIGIEIKSA